MSILRTLTINGMTYNVVPTVPASSVTVLASNWVGSEDKYSQVVTIPGVTAHTKVDLQATSDQLVDFHPKVLGFVAENDGGTVTIFAIGDKPSNDHTFQVTLTEVQAIGKIRGNFVSTTTPRADWAQTDPTKADYIKNKPMTVGGDGVAQETDPTVPAWAKQQLKPTYTAKEVGADPDGTAVGVVEGHNTWRYAHEDIRTELGALTNRVDAMHLGQSSYATKTGLTLGIHTDGLIYLFVDGVPVGTGIELPTGGISGWIDSENNIIINNLPGGNYAVRYEMEDGSMVEIGALELAGNEPDTPAYINQIPISTDANGDPFVGDNGEKGYKSGVRLSVSSGAESSSNAESYETTGFIPVLPGKNVYMKGVPIGDDGKHNICFYRADKSYIAGTTTKLFFDHSDGDVVYGALREVVTNASTAAFIRISSSEITADSIITVDEPIV